jgi:WD40 repeat protein
VFASCDDDGNNVLWDTRNPQEPVFTMRADSSALYSVQFSPIDRHILATAGADSLIKVWDVRNMSEPIIEQHEDGEISQLKWSN